MKTQKFNKKAQEGGISNSIVSMILALIFLLFVIAILIMNKDKPAELIEEDLAELIKIRDFDGDGFPDFYDSCPCGSIFEKSVDLFDDGKSYCVSNYRSNDVCITKNLLDGKTIMKWDVTKNYCYYSKSDCVDYIKQEYRKEIKNDN